jgi:transposase
MKFAPAAATAGQVCQRRSRSASRDLGIHPNLLRNWIKAFESDPRDAFPGQGRMKPDQAEIERLRREVQKLKAERDILKKAAAYFARESK